MIIGFDLDDTITNKKEFAISMVQEYLVREGKSFKLINHNTLSLSEMFNWKMSDYYEFVAKKGYDYLMNVPVRHDAKTVIDSLRNLGYKVYIVTARDLLDPVGITNEYLKKHNIIVDSVIAFASDKVSICKANNISYFIDDNELVIESLLKNGINAYLFNAKKITNSHLPMLDSLTDYYNIIINKPN